MALIDFDHLTRSLVPYLCEHTGLTTAQVQSVLDANDKFWEDRSELYHEVLHWMSCEDVDDDA